MSFTGNDSSPSTRFFGWLLLTVGVLMAGLCGLCTLVVLGIGVSAGFQNGSVLMFMGLVIGGLPTAGGAVLVWVGWRMIRPRAKPVEKTFE